MVMKLAFAINAFLVLCFCQTIKAAQWEPVVNMAIEHLKLSGELPAITSCIGVTESEFLSEYKPILGRCLREHGIVVENEQKEAEMNSCFEKQMLMRFNLSKARLNQCKAKFASDGEGIEDADDSSH